MLPEEITPAPETSDSTQTQETPAVAAMSGVTPDSTTAGLAANVPKEEPNGNIPGTFPETPAQEAENVLSVNPIPASEGIGNPIKLNPGEKVPDPSSIHNNTVDSTVKLDKESYDKPDSVPFTGASTQSETAGESAFSVPPVSKNTIPESSLPIGGPAQQAAAADPGYTIQSAAPTSTTAALAAQVPLEKEKQANDATIQSAAPTSTTAGLASEVPLEKEKGEAEEVTILPAPSEPPVAESKENKQNDATIQSAAPTSTTAALAANVPLEKDKKTNGTEPVKDVPEVVKDSLAEAHQDPEAAANKEAVEEKKDMEQELKKNVAVEESQGAPAPTATAATSALAPGIAASGFDSADVSPTSSPPPGRAAPTSAPPAPPKDIPTSTPKSTGPTATTGVEAGQTPEVSTPKPAEQAKESHGAENGKDDKKKKRLSGFFSKLKEKLK